MSRGAPDSACVREVKLTFGKRQESCVMLKSFESRGKNELLGKRQEVWFTTGNLRHEPRGPRRGDRQCVYCLMLHSRTLCRVNILACTTWII